MTAMLLWRNLKNERNFNNYGIPSSHGRDDRGLLFPHHPSGKQAQKAGGADAQQPEKVEEKAEETPAVEEKATEAVEAPAAEEKPSYDPEIK